MDKPEECTVCYNNYDEDQQRPRCLPCGHTFCSQCMDNGIKYGQLTCPSCRAQHCASAATRFPVNYGMESLIRKLRGSQVAPVETALEKLHRAPARGIGMFQELFPDVTTVHTSVQVEDLRSMSEPVKRLVEAGLVLAVQHDQDDHRAARITLQDGQLYLHPLLRQPTPAHAYTLQESDVVGMLDPFCTLAFLDLAWAGSTRGRVTIRLTPDTPLARQFVLLCTGQRGHTYHNTKLFRVVDKGQPGERVWGGDYERNNGEGGASLLPDLWGQYRESGMAGAVSWWWLGHPFQGAQFIITTRDHQDGRQCPRAFGDVVTGLDVVRAAVNHSDITEVTVVDCGVVLPVYLPSLLSHHYSFGVLPL